MKNLYILFCISILSISINATEIGKISGNMPNPKMSGPTHFSKYFIESAKVVDGKINLKIPINAQKNITIMVTGFETTKVLLDKKSNLKFKKYNTPDLESMEIPGIGSRVKIDLTNPGFHTFELEGRKTTENVNLIISEPDSLIELKTKVIPLAATNGDTVTIEADLSDKVYSPSVTVKSFLSNGKVVQLYDNGQNGDKIPNDGIFTGTFIAETENSFNGLNMRIDAEGQIKNGLPFKRTSSAAVMITSPQTEIENTIVNKDNITITLKEALGKYRVEIIFGKDNQSIAYARDNIKLNDENTTLSIERPNFSKSANKALVRVLNLETLGLEDEKIITLTPLLTDEKPIVNIKKELKIQSLPKSKLEAAKKFGDTKN